MKGLWVAETPSGAMNSQSSESRTRAWAEPIYGLFALCAVRHLGLIRLMRKVRNIKTLARYPLASHGAPLAGEPVPAWLTGVPTRREGHYWHYSSVLTITSGERSIPAQPKSRMKNENVGELFFPARPSSGLNVLWIASVAQSKVVV
jgi:hypothetical protein